MAVQEVEANAICTLPLDPSHGEGSTMAEEPEGGAAACSSSVTNVEAAVASGSEPVNEVVAATQNAAQHSHRKKGLRARIRSLFLKKRKPPKEFFLVQ